MIYMFSRLLRSMDMVADAFTSTCMDCLLQEPEILRFGPLLLFEPNFEPMGSLACSCDNDLYFSCIFTPPEIAKNLPDIDMSISQFAPTSALTCLAV